MNKILALMCVLASIFSSCSHDPKNWLEANNIKGNVISITDSIWWGKIKFGEPQKETLRHIRVYELNEDGNVTSFTEYDGYNGDIENKVVNKWKDSHLVETNAYGPDGNCTRKTNYTFDGDKLIKETIEDYENKKNIESNYYYDSGKLDSIVSKSKEGKTVAKFKWLDENDSYTLTTISPDGSKETITIYNDSKKRIVKMKANDLYTYHYDENGNEDSGTYSHFKYTYKYKLDDRKNWIEKVTYEQWMKEKTRIDEIITRHYEYKK